MVLLLLFVLGFFVFVLFCFDPEVKGTPVGQILRISGTSYQDLIIIALFLSLSLPLVTSV